LLERGPTPGEEAHDIPDEVDVVDAGDVVEGLGVDGLASGCLVVSSLWSGK
jgi:hypothetical protein